MVDAVNDGRQIEDIADEFGVQVIKYNKGIQALIDYKRSGRSADTPPEILIYWGDSGTGKTRKATEDNPDAYILSKPNKDGQVWWDGYQGEDCVIFDEFYGWIPYDTLLRVCDRYPLRVPFKGGFHKLKATRIIFTSNKPWEEWYPGIDDKSALKRRLDEFGTITRFRKLAINDVN